MLNWSSRKRSSLNRSSVGRAVPALARSLVPALVLLCLAACAASGPAVAPSVAGTPETEDFEGPPPIQVMVLGSYHMSGSTSDVVNMKVDNVLTPVRQGELAALADALATFRPTVVAVERQTAAPRFIDRVYETFTDETLSSVPNERTQIGYRLARRMNLPHVYGVDELPSEGEPDYFPFDTLMAKAEALGRADQLQASIAAVQESVGELEKRQAVQSVPELLYFMNAELPGDDAFMYELFNYDEGEDQPGAELQAYWFMRNAKIFSKIAQVTKPGDRVVVVYGAGHKYWLEHFADHTPGFEKVDPAPYLERAIAATGRPSR